MTPAAELDHRLAFYDALTRCGAIVYAVARSILERPTPEARDHVIVIGARDEVVARFDVVVSAADGETHALVTLPRAQVIATLAHKAVGALRHLSAPARPGEVHVAVVSAAGVAAGPLPLKMLAAVAVSVEADAELVSVAVRESDEGRSTH